MSRTARILAVTALIAALAGCSSSGDGGSDSTTPAASGASAAGASLGTLKVGATPVPHAEILKYVKDNLAAKAGLDLQIVEFTDYIQPNVALKEGQIDANYFQTVPYLAEQSAAAGYDFVNVAGVHLEPLGLYSQKIKSVSELADGATIAIPNDPTNGGRALKLLAANNLITLKDTGDTSPTARDIADNPKKLKIVEVEAAQLPGSLQDVDAAVINGNFAIEAGLSPAKDALILESAKDNPNVNILVTTKALQDDPRIKALAGLLQGPEVKAFIQSKYNGAVIPAN
jgi:D-methionine transport system substrate-binding protein